MQKRNKVGGILDRRFGENDPTMAPEDKMLERFAREKQRLHKKSSLFDLEEDTPSFGLTHNGQALSLDGPNLNDDFDEDDLSNDSDASGDERKISKRQRLADAVADLEAAEGEADEDPDRKRTKAEVMKEVIAKSKLHKYERQATREENDDLRMEVDQDFHSIKSLLFSRDMRERPAASAAGGADKSVTFMPGVDKAAMEKEFDIRLKQLAMDKRAQPAAPTKTEEEVAEERIAKLKELEEKRQRRMRGEAESESEEEAESDNEDQNEDERAVLEGGAIQMIPLDKDEDFGLGTGIKARPTATELGLDDEDDFFIEDDLVASGSELDLDEESSSEDDLEANDDGDEDDFTKGLLTAAEEANPEFEDLSALQPKAREGGDDDGIPYTFPCPQTREELLQVIKPYPREKLPTIIQRIRALYHPRLDSKNKERLGALSKALVDFIAAPGESSTTGFATLESVTRHLHSLSKSFALEIAQQLRMHLQSMADSRPTALRSGDLVVLSAIGSIFPTSDHFHQVVTPAMLVMARYLGQSKPQTLADYATGIYLATLTIQYQQLSKRYVPEFMNFCLNTLCALAPVASKSSLGDFPIHPPAEGIRIRGDGSAAVRKLAFSDCTARKLSPADEEVLKASLMQTTIQLLEVSADTWSTKSASLETLQPIAKVLKYLCSKSNRPKLPSALSDKIAKAFTKTERAMRVAELSRRTVELHHHKPLAIKSYMPKFENEFDPNKHYDPDRERAELAQLKAEHKRERKGAMRELRKDAHFMAREKLKIKKAKDEAYEKKFKRLVAEIQGEEGQKSNEYDKEKRARKRARMRG